MRNHQEHQQDQEVLMVSKEYSQENPNLETTHNHRHHHVIVPVDSQKKSHLETTHNHHHVMDVPMDSQKNPNLESTRHHGPSSPSSSSQDFKRTHHQLIMSHVVKKTNHVDQGCMVSKNAPQGITKPYVSCSSLAAGGDMTTPAPPPPPQPQERLAVVEESGREKLKRHRLEMAGRVWIPDIWGHEDLLKDWIDCTVFDSSLGNNNIMSARAALVKERRSTLRIDNRC
ncbi:hypothetical protein Lser_V15G26454 [Lactuca serriola]